MKKIIASLAAISFLVSPLFATQSRLGGLGISNWMIEEDNSNMYFNPARMIYYPKTIWGELGTAVGAGVAPRVNNNVTISNQWGGVSGLCPIIEGATVGVFLNRPYPGILGSAGQNATGSGVTAIPANGFGNNMTALTPQTRFDLFYALPFSGFKLGALLNVAGDSLSNDNKTTSSPLIAGNTTSNNEISSSEINVVVGAQARDVLFASDLDLALTLGFPSAKNTYKVTQYSGTAWVTTNDWIFQTNSSLNLGITARAAIPLKNNPLLAYFNYTSNNVSNTFTDQIDAGSNSSFNDAGDTNYKQERTQKQSALTFGASYNVKTSPKTLMIVAANINQGVATNNASTTQLRTAVAGKNQQYDSETTTIALPVNFAIEQSLAKSFAMRMGVSQNIIQQTTTKTSAPTLTWNATTSSYQQTQVAETTAKTETLGGTTISIGAGIDVFRGLTVDAVVRQQVLFSGTYLVSGIPETLVSQLSATYKF